MPHYDSQTPDAPDIEQLFKRLSSLIPKAVRYACRINRHPTNQDEINDLSQEIRLLMLDNDYEKLRSFNHCSSPETWLSAVVRHHVRRYLQRQRKQGEAVSLEEMAPDSLTCPPVQEKMLISEDERMAFWTFVRSLPARKRQLMELTLQGLKTEEIAKEMRIEVGHVYGMRHDLKKRLRGFLEEKGINLPDGSLGEILEIFFR